jgi:large subunit ribosomal protein L21
MNSLEMTMYAVVSTGGKQYRVEAGSLLTLERLDGQPGEPGASVTFDRVLLISDGEEVTVGTPVVSGASVSATVIGEALGPKLVIFKFKQKVKYRRRNGHRQHLTQVRIDGIHPTAASRQAASKAEAEPGSKAEPKARPQPKAKADPKAKAEIRKRPQPKAKVAATKAAQKPAATKPAAAKAEAKVARPRAARPAAAKAETASKEATADKPKVRRAPRPKAKE